MSSPSTTSNSVEFVDESTSTNNSPTDSTPQDSLMNIENVPSSPRPMRIYTRRQLVSLSQSPLVKPPPDMPELKTWFGMETENLANKKDEPTTPSSARERRFRRDAEDADAPSRPTFRSTLQPSQMGNFKHQSLRASDRDRDRDRDREGDKERERDIRDKEGQERLRHLSDKYDRDRLLPLSTSRTKERDAAPHLSANNSRGQQAVPSNGVSRRADTREAAKKKVGEASEDWRRGSDPVRSNREDRAENGRRDREDRDGARSKGRDSSRPKRESSTSRRDRDRDEPRDRPRDRDRDDHRREKDDSRRERDDADDDPRRWRDDGKREERMAARRDRGRGNPDRDADDRRWTTVEDRDGRYKRTTGRDRDRKGGNGADDGKDKEDRREKEKEPAWMDNYVPNDDSPGILGGQAPTGELDGIQAWKKGLKEKESKEKEGTGSIKAPAEQASSSTTDKIEFVDLQMFQNFKNAVAHENSKRPSEPGSIPTASEGVLSSSNKETVSTPAIQTRQREDTVNVATTQTAPTADLTPQPHAVKGFSLEASSAPLDVISPASSILKDIAVLSSAKANPEPLQDRAIVAVKGFPTSSPEIPGNLSKQHGDFGPNASFPPSGSRVLAMKNKGGPASNSSINLQSLNAGLANLIQDPPQQFVKNEPLRSLAAFSPFEDPNRQSYGFEDARELPLPPIQTAASHRAPLDQFTTNMHPQTDLNYNGSVGKGSRLARIIENKGRDLPNGPPKQMMQDGYMPSPPNQNQRQELNNLGGASGNHPHSVEQLMAMLNQSSMQRTNLGPSLSNANPLLANNSAFNNHGPSLHSLQQQQLLQQQQHHSSSRLEPLYDSRSDDRNFVPDGMVPGLRTMPPPPPRGRDSLSHFNDPLDDPIHYNLQHLAAQQQQQARSLDPLYSGPTQAMFNQHGGRHGGGLPLPSIQQPHYRGGPSPSLNQGVSISNGPQQPQQQRLPPGLANLGGRPPHEPSQFIGLPGLPSGAPQHNMHGNGPLPQHLPFNNYNLGNNLAFNGSQGRGPGPTSHLQNNGTQQLPPLRNLGHPNMDPRLSNHHHLMGLGGSGVGGNPNRINGGFPPQQGPNVPNHNHLGIRPQPHHLQQHGLPQIGPHHVQQQGHQSSTPDLMAILMGGPHRD